MRTQILCILVYYFQIFITTTAKSLPPNINRCSLSDPQFNNCLEINMVDGFKKFAHGYKPLAIPSLEPFLIEHLDLGNSSSGSVNLHQVYKNMRLHGMTDTTISKLEASFDEENCFWRFIALTPQLRMESSYKMTGKVLIFPLNGEGDCNNIMYDLNVIHEMKCEIYTKHNEQYLRIVDYKFDMKPKQVVFDFQNIIKGNEQLSKEILKTLNDNALEVYKDVAPAFSQGFSQIYKQIGNTVFAKVPLKEIFLP